MKFINYLPTLVFIVCAIIITSTSGTVNAQNTTIGATVKTNICGNGVVEPPVEDCEGLDLNFGTCQSQGFLEGELACDISCEYDTSGCFGIPTPTPSPTPTSVPTTTPVVIEPPITQEPDFVPTQTPVPSDPADSLIDLVDDLIDELIYVLPRELVHLDIDGDGKINSHEVTQAVQLWVLAWREQESGECDLNADQFCNIVDFSVLMYHVDK